jgi:pyrimidine deaminase RibD-like protein
MSKEVILYRDGGTTAKPAREGWGGDIKKLASVAALALALSGCSTVTTLYGELSATTIPPQTALVAANSFDVIETTATAYLSLPACGSVGATIACRNAAAVAKIVPSIRAGRVARNGVEALLRANSGAAIPVATYNTLQSAVATLQGVYAAYNISAK